MDSFETFTDEEITTRLSVPMIIDAFWAHEYGREVSPITREVGRSLMYLVRKYGKVIPHSLLLAAVEEHAEVSKSTIAPFIDYAVDADMISVVVPAADERQRLYGFSKNQRSKILRATNAAAYAAALGMEQAKDPTNVEHGKTAANTPYYRHIFNRINNPNEAIVKKLAKLRKRLAWTVVAALCLGAAVEVADVAQNEYHKRIMLTSDSSVRDDSSKAQGPAFVPTIDVHVASWSTGKL
jgi:hypothetical protein